MSHRYQIHCDNCESPRVIKKGHRRGLQRYRCKRCGTYFSRDPQHVHPFPVALWKQHIDGLSFRTLGDEYGFSGKHAYDIVTSEMDRLPENSWLTCTYCSRWSGILHIDGKYINVEGYKKKIPFIWSVDYFRHDFPIGLMAPSENTEAFTRLFRLLKTAQYPLRLIIADDTVAIRRAKQAYFPYANVQLCHTHYIENIRTEETYHEFFDTLVERVFHEPAQERDPRERERLRDDGFHDVLNQYALTNEILEYIVMDVAQKRALLFAYEKIPTCPCTNNIIESFNSHLNGRLKTIKKFQSLTSAQRWTNAYLIRRRTKRFTDCHGRFTKFNGYMPLQLSLKKSAQWPTLFGIPPLSKTEQKPYF